MPEDEWSALKSSYRTTGLTMSCGQPGVPKTSSLGLQFFAHKLKADCQLHEGGETPEHLRAKAIVAEVARELGWKSTVEFMGPDREWIADVLLERGNIKLAIEIQWSAQTEADFVRRQARYTNAELECRWLVSEKNLTNAQRVPNHAIAGTADELRISVPGRPGRTEDIALSEGFARLLRGDVRSRVEVATRQLHVSTAMARCWRPECNQWLSLWHLEAVQLETRCGHALALSKLGGYRPWLVERSEIRVEDSVRSAISRSGLPSPIRYEVRTSKQVDRTYAAQICPSCGVLQGDGHVAAMARNWTVYEIPHRERLPLDPGLLRLDHLCEDQGHGRCEPPSALPARGLDQFPVEDMWWLQVGTYEAEQLPERKGSKRR